MLLLRCSINSRKRSFQTTLRTTQSNQSESMRVSLTRPMLLLAAAVLLWAVNVTSFMSPISTPGRLRPVSGLKMSMQDIVIVNLPRIMSTLQLADTSISEEEVLNTVGQAGDLPDPFFTVLVAGVIVLGVAVLQFSLGDLTKEVKTCSNVMLCLPSKIPHES